jgi:excisionase family DNA binding protein
MQGTETDEDLLTVSEVAKRLRVKCSWVYRHADALGAYHLGKYVRFRWSRVLERMETGIE